AAWLSDSGGTSSGIDDDGRGGRGAPPMSTGASQQGTGGGPDEVSPGRPETNGVPPLAADRPYVDGTAVSAEDLRAEVERLSNEDRQHVDDLREEVGDSLTELKARFDVKARVAERKDEAVAAVHQHV